MPRHLQIALPLLLSAALLLGGLALRKQRQEADHAERLRLEEQLRVVPLFVDAPDVTLYDRSESPRKLSSYRGKHVFVNFWATWCGPCIAEMPSLIALQEALDPADIAFVSIAEDDTNPPLDRYLARSPLPFDVYRDRPPRVEIPFETTSYPTSFLIGPDGQALYRFNGARDWRDPALLELFDLEGIGRR